MPVKAVNIGGYGYMPFSFGCVRAVYNGGIYMKFAVFLHSDNSASLALLSSSRRSLKAFLRIEVQCIEFSFLMVPRACVTPVRMSASSKVLFSYKCGFNQGGEMWLVRKSNTELSAAETARYIHEQIINGSAISIPFRWLQSEDRYITELLSSENLSGDEYYLA